MRTLIFGASAGIGRALARSLAARGHDVVLIARDASDVAAEAAHLRAVYGVDAVSFAADAVPAAALAQALLPVLNGPAIDNIAFPLGMAERADDAMLDPARIAALVDANLTSVMIATSLFLPQMMARGGGSIVGFGSVAALRGRGSNVAYAAAKRGLESFFESLRHRTTGSGVTVQFYRLGYVATQMSFGLPLPFPAATPQRVAAHVASRLGRDQGLLHLPRFWWLVGMGLRLVPWALYRRMKF